MKALFCICFLVVGCSSDSDPEGSDDGGTCSLDECVAACLAAGRSGGSCRGGACACLPGGNDGGDGGETDSIPTTEIDCFNWYDDDHDNLMDCVDPDCRGVEGCAVCGNGVVEPGEECEPDLPPTACTSSCMTEGTQACDGFCQLRPECVPPRETCNGRDDDCDGLIDNGLERCRCASLSEFELSVSPLILHSEDIPYGCTLGLTNSGHTGRAAQGSDPGSHGCDAYDSSWDSVYPGSTYFRVSVWTKIVSTSGESSVNAIGFLFDPSDGTIGWPGKTERTPYTVGEWVFLEVYSDFSSPARPLTVRVNSETLGIYPRETRGVPFFEWRGAIVLFDDLCVQKLN